ncbi:unnamed protein product [Periconia digitata]|uniref:Ubiquitin-like domain-containing protein n=1 Tax=Periconia digitata TaxID=1303443 RepID=A0A9W4UMT9_9PLEO|nr:unnamed protein product [Periconia digitata]
MPITFGAVGDILSVCLLVKDLVNALDKVRGSKAEYQSLTRELWILDRVLLEVDLLARTHDGGRTPELNAFCQTAREAVDRCKTLVSDFLARLRKYQNSFEEGGSSSSNVFKTTAMKVRWRVGEKDAVEKFRVDIAATSASLQMLLTTATVNLLSIHVDKVDKRMSDIHKNNEAHHTKADATLASLLDRLEETNILFTFKNSMTSKIADALRLDWLHQLVSEWTSLLRRVIAMNIATYRAFLKIQSALSSCRERVLIEEPLTLEDAIGRITPIHLQFVRSWDAFNAVLEIRFRNMEGHTKVKKQQYKLQDKVTKRDILPGKSWDGVFFPGQRVEMSFIFDQDGNRTESTCPSCQASSISPLTEEIQCSNCHLWYRRVTIMQDTEEPPQRPSHPQWKSSEPAFGQTGLEGVILGPAKPGIKRASSSDPDDSALSARILRDRDTSPLPPYRVLHQAAFEGVASGLNQPIFTVEGLRQQTQQCHTWILQPPWKKILKMPEKRWRKSVGVHRPIYSKISREYSNLLIPQVLHRPRADRIQCGLSIQAVTVMLRS